MMKAVKYGLKKINKTPAIFFTSVAKYFFSHDFGPRDLF